MTECTYCHLPLDAPLPDNCISWMHHVQQGPKDLEIWELRKFKQAAEETCQRLGLRVNSLEDENARHFAESERLLVVLRSVEWSGGHCPECGAVRWGDDPQDKTHNPGCALFAALGDAP